MKLISKKKGAIIFLLSTLICSVCLFFGGIAFKASAEEEIIPTTGIFVPSDVQLSPSQIPEDSSSLVAGVKLSTTKEGGSISLKNKLIGRFSYAFEPIKEQGVLNLKNFDTVFTDESGASFTLRLSYGATNNASVIFNGVETGINYPINSNRYNNTTYANANGVYTPFQNGEISVVFDPDQMTIAVGTAGSESIVWDFSESINDGRDVKNTLDVFKRYNVKFVFSNYNGERCAALIRKINDCSLAGLILEGTGTPSIVADFTQHAIVRNTYTLPEALAGDLWDGELNTKVEVYGPTGELIAKNAKYFIPFTEGTYTVKYTAENERGVKGEKVYEINAYNPENIPEYTFTLDSNTFEKTQYFSGESIYVPVMKLNDGIYLSGSSIANIVVEYNGAVIGAYNKVPGGFNFKFNKKGVYEFTYDLNGKGTETYTVNVLERTNYLKSDLKEFYVLNENVDLRNAKIIIGDIEVDAEISVQYPNGTIYKNNFFQCTEIGQYKVTAKATYNGTKYVTEETFETNGTVADLFETGAGITAEFGKSSFTGKDGVLLTFAGGKLSTTYKNPIDITKYVNQTQENVDKNGEKIGTYSAAHTLDENNAIKEITAIPLVSISIDPASYGVAAAEEYYVHLTDALDPTNVLSIVFHRTDSAAWTYLRAKAGDQDYSGFNNNNNGKVTWAAANQKGDFFKAGRYGFGQGASFTGYINNFSAENQFVTIYYDNVKKQILAKPSNTTYTNWIACDLDDPSCCNGTPWNGFTSDKVYLSVESGTVNTATVTIPIYAIDGIQFNNEQVIYDQNPTLTVKKTNVKSIAGYSVKVPEAEAFDKFGNQLEVIAKAYEVDGDNLYDVKIKDGKFLTTKEGANAYKIVYTAIDVYGNRTDLTRYVDVFPNNYDDVAIEYMGSTIPEEYTSGITGAEIPVYSDVVVSNTVGGYTLSVTVTGPETLKVKNGKILPTAAGIYTVTHKVTDELGRVSNAISYTVDVAVAQDPIASSSVPAYFGFVRGNTYQLLDVYAVDYNQSTEPVKAEIWVDGELNTTGVFSKEKLVEAKDVGETNEKVVIEYKVNGKTVYSNGQELKFEVPLKTIYKTQDVKQGTQTRPRETYLLERYFATKDAQIINPGKDSLVLKPTVVGGLGSATFLSPLNSNNFQFKFDIADKKNGDYKAIEPTTSSIKISIINQTDVSKKVVLEFKYDEITKATKVYLNGNEMTGATTLSGLLTGQIASVLEIKYNAKSNVLSENNTKIEISKIVEYADGTAFEGFSENVYLMVEVTAVDGKVSSGIIVQEICAQPFPGGILYNDNYAPAIALNGSCGGSYSVGEKFTIPSATAYDVLSDVDARSLTVTVTNNGTPVTDVNGKTLNSVSATQEYVVELSQTGKYVITYNVKDARGGVMPKKEYVLTVRIDEAPVISAVEIKDTVKKGDEIKVPIPEVTFAEESQENTFYMVYVKPNNEYQWFVEGDVITAETTGTYRILFMAIDAYGNSSYVEYHVICY